MIAGATSGLLMASFFVGAGVLIAFNIVKDPPATLTPVLKKVPLGPVTMALVLLAYPTWSVIGIVMGLLYEISIQRAPGPGLGSSNIVFTVVVILATIMVAAPFVILFRRVAVGVLVLAIGFIGIFGWLLPFFAS